MISNWDAEGLINEIPVEPQEGFLKIAAFNIQNLGRTKMGRPLVVDAIVKVNYVCLLFVSILVLDIIMFFKYMYINNIKYNYRS